jgi:hypothetical protein
MQSLTSSSNSVKPRVFTIGKDRLPKNIVWVVGSKSRWDCPYRVPRDGSREEVLEKYRRHLITAKLLRHLQELRGKDLACFCSSNRSICHAELLLHLANFHPA